MELTQENTNFEIKRVKHIVLACSLISCCAASLQQWIPHPKMPTHRAFWSHASHSKSNNSSDPSSFAEFCGIVYYVFDTYSPLKVGIRVEMCIMGIDDDIIWLLDTCRNTLDLHSRSRDPAQFLLIMRVSMVKRCMLGSVFVGGRNMREFIFYRCVVPRSR